MRVRAILDTNVVVSGIFWKGPPFEILSLWQRRRFTLCVSLPILREYRRVLDEIAIKRSIGAAMQILELIELHAEVVDPISFAMRLCDDPDDDKFLEAALASRADYIVSGDAALLRVEHCQGVQIVKPAKFLKIVS